jgi:hypothetical protein
LLAGDVALRLFIAQQVDRLNDIVSNEVEIKPILKSQYHKLIDKRLQFYHSNPKVIFPIDLSVFTYLYEITEGRLRYVFGLLQRLTSQLHVADLTDMLTLDILKPMVTKLPRDRITRKNLSPGDETVLRVLVKLKEASVSQLAKKSDKSANHTSNI